MTDRVETRTLLAVLETAYLRYDAPGWMIEGSSEEIIVQKRMNERQLCLEGASWEG